MVPAFTRTPPPPPSPRPSVPRCPRSIVFWWRGFFGVQPGAFTSSKEKHRIQLLELVLAENQTLGSCARAVIWDRCDPSFP